MRLSFSISVMLALAGCGAAPVAVERSAAVLERGRYLVETTAYCGACHTPIGPGGKSLEGMALAGGRILEQRGFRAVVPNITPDRETGIGRWSDAEIRTALREGRRPDGSLIGPPMPIEMYRQLSDADMAAIIAYLRTVPAVRHDVPGRSRYPFALTAYGKPVAHVADPPAGNRLARGRYLAGPVAHCMECHTPPLAGEKRDWAKIGAGGLVFEGPWGAVVSANISSSRTAGIGGWSDARIIRTITSGRADDGRVLAPPMGGRADDFRAWKPDDLKALITYLRSLPPQGD